MRFRWEAGATGNEVAASAAQWQRSNGCADERDVVQLAFVVMVRNSLECRIQFVSV